MRTLKAVLFALLLAVPASAQINVSSAPSSVTSSGTNIWSGLNIFGTADGASNSIAFGRTAGCIEFEGSTADTNQTFLCGGNATTDKTLTLTAGTNSFFVGHSGIIDFGASSTSMMRLDTFSNVRVTFGGRTCCQWTSSNSDAAGTTDVSLYRIAAGVLGTAVTIAGSPGGWVQLTSGRSTLAADYTNATTTFSNTALSITVQSGRKYNFHSILFTSDSLAADGAKYDFNGGTAAATNFRAHCTLFDTALLQSTQVTALATAFTQATQTGNGMFECYGSFEPSGAGTFIIRAAQNAHTTGTLTVARGSFIWVEDMP